MMNSIMIINYYKLLCLNYYRTNMYQGLKNKDLPNISLKSVNLNNFII